MTPPLTRAVAGAVDETLLELYRALHAHPELSGQEAGTAERLASALEAAGCTVQTGIGGHGVAAVLGDGPGPTLLVRADMDALPVGETTGLAYASRATGTDPNGNEVPVMHACGHDLHMAALVGLARAMQALRGSWRGRLVLVGQPSEERVSGAAAMIADGLYAPRRPAGLCDRPPRRARAARGHGPLHRGNGIGRGRVDRPPGPRPRRARGPPRPDAGPGPPRGRVRRRRSRGSSAGSSTPSPSACLRSPSIHGGVKHNAIPDEVRLGLNIRFFDDAVRARLLEGIERVAAGLARAAGVSGGPDACPHAPRRVRPAAHERPGAGPPGPRRGRGARSGRSASARSGRRRAPRTSARSPRPTRRSRSATSGSGPGAAGSTPRPTPRTPNPSSRRA